MRILEAGRSALVLIDLQQRLVPALEGGDAMVANAGRLLRAAAIFEIPAIVTEQNPRALGSTVPGLPVAGLPCVAKMTMDACRAAGFAEALPSREQLLLAGCEAHVCVLQTALALLESGRRVYVVADAVASRTASNHDAALRRLELHGVEIVTTEMVVFEWLGGADHPRFREVVALVK